MDHISFGLCNSRDGRQPSDGRKSHALRYEPNRGDGRDPRSKALELFTAFEREMATTYSTNYSRLPGTNVRSFLLRCTNGPLASIGQRELHLVADDYEHARHRHEKFGQVRREEE